LIVMVCIAGLVAYFRFFRSAEKVGMETPVAASAFRPGMDLAPPPVPKPLEARGGWGGNDTRRHISRNIFEPAGPLPAVSAPKAIAPKAESMEMTLSGIIVGGEMSIAIINHRFMRQGQKLGKYRITRITQDKVYLTAGDDRRCLSVLTVSDGMATP
jgi:hypothetical protein